MVRNNSNSLLHCRNKQCQKNALLDNDFVGPLRRSKATAASINRTGEKRLKLLQIKGTAITLRKASNGVYSVSTLEGLTNSYINIVYKYFDRKAHYSSSLWRNLWATPHKTVALRVRARVEQQNLSDSVFYITVAIAICMTIRCYTLPRC